MNSAVERMLERYNCSSVEEYTRSLQEIIQVIALLGLWRAKFFEHAAFYGGTALRILYGLDRFSEDLDFSLLFKQDAFTLTRFLSSIKEELASFGFDVEISVKEKTKVSAIQSAFLKANTLEHLLRIGYKGPYHKDGQTKIKLEVDKDPPLGFRTEAKIVMQPTPFPVKTFLPSDLFAGKLHALLFRRWGKRVKGRDWYDFIWYISHNIPLHLKHFNERFKQSEGESVGLSEAEVRDLLTQRIVSLDIEQAKEDVGNFVRDRRSLEAWSPEFFFEIARHMKIVKDNSHVHSSA
jgi:Nucleotidyl transferase AbiEii toxin, Type IV TA system